MVAPIRATAMVVTALWAGTLFFVGFVFAPYVFALAARGDANVPNSGVAADLVGPLLYGSDVAGLVIVLPLLACLAYLRFRRQTPLGGRYFVCEIALVLAGGCASINYWGLTPRLTAVQEALAARYGGFHLADKTDPLYATFTTLHQSATALFMLAFVCSLICLVCFSHFRSAERTLGT